MRSTEERNKMVQVLKNLQSQGQSRDLQIEVIEKANHPDIFAEDYKGEIPNMADDERNALSWLYGRTTDEGLLGSHVTPAEIKSDPGESEETE